MAFNLSLYTAFPGQINEETRGEDAEDEEAELPVPRVRVVGVTYAQVPLRRDRQARVGRAWKEQNR